MPPFAKNRRDEMENSLLDAVAGEKYDWVFTHNLKSPGEYWDHANHFEAAQIVERLVTDGQLTEGVGRMVQFSYRWEGTLKKIVGRDTASHHMPLTDQEMSKKLAWLYAVPDRRNMEALGFPWLNPEAFEGSGLPPPFIAVKGAVRS